ncbi:MAG: hypothetical protein JWN80_1449 [Microbacteriaceae bacterium]|nr:hypothetical protein [Microbacteriaceae bacterium]
MPDECIHGFEAGLCDTCYPKPVPVVVATATTTTTRSRTATTTSRASASSRADHKVGEQRIYHVTHIDNLPLIIESNAVLAGQLPAVDISSTENRAARRDTPVGDDTVVADYIPFFLSPNSSVWAALREQLADPRLSPEARDIPPAEFVILVSTVKVASTMEIAVANGDAANTFTRIANTPDTNDRALRGLRADDDAILGAELLVRGAFPFEQVSLVGVANDRARDAVKQVLQLAAHEPKVAVYPPWFGR